MSKDNRCCKTCAFWDFQGKRVVKLQAARCTAPEPDLPQFPESITKYYGFRWPPGRTYTSGEDGVKCPVWSPKPKVKPETVVPVGI